MENKLLKNLFYNSEDIAWDKQESGISRKVFPMENLMLVQYKIPGGMITDSDHFHIHEQGAYIISGRVIMEIEGKRKELSAGSVYLVPSNVKHHIETLEETIVLDCFNPPREDLIEKNELIT